MLIQETINDLLYTHSDSGFYIEQVETGIKYEEAWDVIPSEFTYIETEELIPVKEEEDLWLNYKNAEE